MADRSNSPPSGRPASAANSWGAMDLPSTPAASSRSPSSSRTPTARPDRIYTVDASPKLSKAAPPVRSDSERLDSLEASMASALALLAAMSDSLELLTESARGGGPAKRRNRRGASASYSRANSTLNRTSQVGLMVGMVLRVQRWLRRRRYANKARLMADLFARKGPAVFAPGTTASPQRPYVLGALREEQSALDLGALPEEEAVYQQEGSFKENAPSPPKLNTFMTGPLDATAGAESLAVQAQAPQSSSLHSTLPSHDDSPLTPIHRRSKLLQEGQASSTRWPFESAAAAAGSPQPTGGGGGGFLGAMGSVLSTLGTSKVAPDPAQGVRRASGAFAESTEDLIERIEMTSKGRASVDVASESIRSTKKQLRLGAPAVKCRQKPLFMINPRSSFRMFWDLACVMPLLLYLAVIMPFRLAFNNEPVIFSAVYWLEFSIDLAFIVDICFNFRTGYFLDGEGDDAALVEYDDWLVITKYGQSWFVLDVVSGIPFALIELLMESSTGDASTLKLLKSLRLIRFLKLGRLLKVEKILSNLDRETLDRLEDFMNDQSTRSVVILFGLALKTGYICHLLSCFWVAIGRLGSHHVSGDSSWLDFDMNGPYTASDTESGSKHVGSIYLASFYFCFTTMTSVGYGDITARSNLERIFVIILEFVGGFTFAMIIASLTAVVTSMDMNARKTAEQLDAVASFVMNRKFPAALGRRVRRHFRHFYSLKSAIDETKIFSELSTALRKEVSSYLVMELMGDVELFRSMSSVLWPRLLPLLRPMRFEVNEVVCIQGEDCTEMYVVLQGGMQGITVVEREREPRTRRILAGDTVNILCVLGVWNKCVESTIANGSVESYAITEKDFASLFTSEADLQAFEEMKEREVACFKMEDFAGSPTEFGRPLYANCFNMLDVTIVQARGLSAADSNGLSDPFAVAEVVDLVTGEPLSALWSHRTAKIRRTLDPQWFEGPVSWNDISAPFSRLALRVTVYDGDLFGPDTFLGCSEVSLAALLASPKGAKASTPLPPPFLLKAKERGSMSRRSSNLSGGGSGGEDDAAGAGNGSGHRSRARALAPCSPQESEQWLPLKPLRQGRAWASAGMHIEGKKCIVLPDSAIGGVIQIRTRVRRAESERAERGRSLDWGRGDSVERLGARLPGSDR